MVVQSPERLNTRLVGFHDLQGRETLQVELRGNWCFAGHFPGHSFNPLNGKQEENGTSILDVSDPENPTMVSHIPGDGANYRAVQVLENFFNGNDYLVRCHDKKGDWSFEVFNISDRAHPERISTISETPLGKITYGHKGWWDRSTGLYFGAVGEQGFRHGGHMVIWDLSNPYKPKYVSSHWIHGQRLDEPERTYVGSVPRGDYQKILRPMSLHHPVVDMDHKRVYLCHNWGGNFAVADISDVSAPKTILDFVLDPPFRGPHTAMPLYQFRCPNFTPGYGDIRDLFVIVCEAFDGDYVGNEIRTMVFMLDVTCWNNPIVVDTFKVPDGDFLERGGRFGTHQYAETRDGKFYSLTQNNNLLFLAYFSAGLRILDLSDPFSMKEVGYYVPETTPTTIPRLKKVVQTNDVDIDYRGLAYITDRAGTGLHIIEHLKK